MSDKDFERQVETLEKLASDKGAQQDLGKRLVEEVARAVMAERKGAEIDNPDVELPIRVGDLVPEPFRDRVKVDEKGRALHDATIQSQNLVIWLRIWLRMWLRIYMPWDIYTTPLNRFEDFHEKINFSDVEVNALERLRKLTR
ncbi:MAG: hypothetical protein ACRBCL_08885 [Maritimibacter sp.]